MKKVVMVKDLAFGGGEIYVQSMLTKKVTDIDGCLNEIIELKDNGCHIIRMGIEHLSEVKSFGEIAKKSPIPTVVDVHFNHQIAVAAIEAGADKVRINPSNIGSTDKIKAVVDAAKANNVAIRVGVNLGSLEAEIAEKYGHTAMGLYKSAEKNVNTLLDLGFDDIVISAKASDVYKTVEANRLIHKNLNFPLHLGVTEAGTESIGILKGAVGIGSLLLDGIGDTIRFSLTAPPLREVIAANNLLKALSIKSCAEVISCPTCARCNYDLFSLVSFVEKATAQITKKIKVAVMGCVVNGVGEGKMADIGIACSGETFVIFEKGVIVEKCTKQTYKDRFLDRLSSL